MSDTPDFLDLVHVIASRGGPESVGGIASDWNTPFSATLANEIGSGGILVFVLVDGMGEEILGRLAPDSFLRRHRRHSLLSVFPSTTACAMTSLATGLPPAGHGIPGRYMYLPELRLHINALSFRARSDNSRVSQVPPERIWPCPPTVLRDQAGQVTVMPAILAGSPFATYLCGRNPVQGYSSIRDAVDRVLRAEREALAPALIFLYLWDLDALCHEKGPGHDDSLELLGQIDAQMDRLACGLKESSRLVISADHGQYDLDEADRLSLRPGHPLMDHLVTIPFGEPRAAQFLVKPGQDDAFRKEFERSFGDFFSLLRMDSDEVLALFGARPAGGVSGDGVLSPLPPFEPFVRRNLGNFCALSREKSVLVYEDAHFTSGLHRGEHGGNLPAERLVPLILN